MESTSAASGSSASVFRTGRSGLVPRPNWFELYLNVNQFKREEVMVQIVDRTIVVHAKHEERADQHGFCSREFSRQFNIPDSVRPRSIKSIYYMNGILVIKAPEKIVSAKKAKRSKEVPVRQQMDAEAEREADNAELALLDILGTEFGETLGTSSE